MVNSRVLLLAVFMVSGLAIATTADARKKLPETTPDGLDLVPKTKLGAVYRKPDVDFTVYQELGIVPCQVTFRKNWQRDQNEDNIDLMNRVTKSDVDRIKKSLSGDCDKFFRESLGETPPYELVDEFDKGEMVLIVRPSIIDLDIKAPDLHTAGMERSYTTSAGEMTLVLELLDGSTGDALARVYDRAASTDTGQLQWTNSATNRAEADRVLKRWSKALRDNLDVLLR